MIINSRRIYNAYKKEARMSGATALALTLAYNVYANIGAPATDDAHLHADLANNLNGELICYEDNEPIIEDFLVSNHFNIQLTPPKPDFDIPEEGELYPLDDTERAELEAKYQKFGLEPQYQTQLISLDGKYSYDYGTPKALAEALARYQAYTDKYQTITYQINENTFRDVEIPEIMLEATFMAQEKEGINGYALLLIAIPESLDGETLDLKAFNKKTKARGPYQFIESTGLMNIAATNIIQDAELIKSFRHGKRRTGYYIPENPHQGYSRENIDKEKTREVLDTVYFDPYLASKMMAINLRNDQLRYASSILESHETTKQDLHSTHFRGAGGAIKYYWRLKNSPDEPGYALYEKRDDDGNITSSGMYSDAVQNNLHVYNKKVVWDSDQKEYIAAGEWRTHAEISEYYEKRGITNDPIELFVDNGIEIAFNILEEAPTSQETRIETLARNDQEEQPFSVTRPRVRL